MVLAVDTSSDGKSVLVDGIAVFYQDSGPKDAEILLFIHGWGCDISFWRRQIEAFSGSYRCIALDLPGFGRSDKPQNVAYTLSLFAKAVKAVADDAGATDLVLVGHSMGFAVTRQFLIEYPDIARAVVNVDGAVLFLPEDAAQRAAIVEGMAHFAQRTVGPEREKMMEEFVEGLFLGKTPEDVRAVVREVMTAIDPYVCASSMTEFVKPEWWESHLFDVPCLALYAENPLEDPNIEEKLRGEFPRLTFTLWNDTGHFLMMEKPERFDTALRKFLNTVHAHEVADVLSLDYPDTTVAKF